MYLESFSISNFRNFGRVKEVKFPKGGLLVAAAPNATGKTNFLESIAVLLRGKSWRAKHGECVAWGEDGFLLHGKVVKGKENIDLVAVRYHTPSRKIRIEENEAPVSVVSFYNHYPLVLFVPEDAFLLTRGPAQRRNFLNQALVSSPQYLSALVQYYRVLRQRNQMIKSAARAEEAQVWTRMLNEHAAVLWKYRENFIEFIDLEINKVYGQISGEEQDIQAGILIGAKNKETYYDDEMSSFGIERRYGYTLYGPHRDDLLIEANGYRGSMVLSRGQMRSVVLALKILAYKFIKQTTKETPILLLDDALSELDEERQEALLNNLPTAQVLLTCTTVPKSLEEQENVFILDLGSIVKKSNLKPDDSGGGLARVEREDGDKGVFSQEAQSGLAEAPIEDRAPVYGAEHR